jgi:hypothetical protein
MGCSWRETDAGSADREALIRYRHPVPILAFNTAEGWSLDVSEEIVNELQNVWDRGELMESVEEFIQEHATQKCLSS